MALPTGFTTLTPFVSYDNASEAIAFYKQALGAKEIERIPLPNGKISYALLEIGNARLMVGDVQPARGVKSANMLGGSPVSFYVYVDDVDAAFKRAEEAGMSVLSPVEDQFWGDRMGALIDRFQIMWTLAQHVRDVSKEELAASTQAMYAEPAEKNQ